MDSFNEVINVLEKHHGIFAQLCQIGKPRFTDEIPTAAIGFNEDGGFVEFAFNPDFYESLNTNERAAVVAHECLHVILNHGVRSKDMEFPELANIAMDIVVNEMLIKGFDFDPSMNVFKTAMFHEKVFGDDRSVEKNREFEYYYEKLRNGKQFQNKAKGTNGGKPMDDHNKLPGSKEISMEIEQALKGLSKEETKKLVDKLKKSGEKDGMDKDKENPLNRYENGKEKGDDRYGKQAGTSGEFAWITSIAKKRILRKWEKLVKKYVIRAFNNKDVDQFIRENRRFSILSARDAFLLPSEYEAEEDNGKIDVVFFMDISGSCAEISEKFFQSAKSIPQDKFKIDAYAFNTDIIPVDLKSDRFPSGGGTSFHQLEAHLQTMKRYPSLVFVLTDGMGTTVEPEFPQKWHIFLTEDYKGCFPDTVNFHNFEDYECD